jgi:SAM-dependent methyltransferase
MPGRVLRILSNPLRALDKLLALTLWQICIPYSHNSRETVHVDLGSGSHPRNPFGATKVIGTDFHSEFQLRDDIQFVQLDLTSNLPFGDNSVDSFSSYDVLEHIPRWERVDGNIHFPFIELMSEIHRCLKPGGIFLAVTPAYPSPVAFQDPTHVNVITTKTVEYFSGALPSATTLGYGFKGNFITTCQSWIYTNSIFELGTPERDLLNSRITAKASVILKLENFKKLPGLAMNLAFKKRTHLLWVLTKPK